MAPPSSRLVIIFAKRPRVGAVKTRLGRDIGAVAAAWFQRWALRRTASRLAHDPRWRTWLAVAPDRAVEQRGWPAPVPVRCPLVPQGPGDLGQRMRRALTDLPPGVRAAVLIGSDIPDIGRTAIAHAFAALRRSDVVFGPSGDGGYWLIGVSRRCGRPLPPLSPVRWSGPFALSDTRAALGVRPRIRLIETLNDVDTGTAWHAWRARHGGIRLSTDRTPPPSPP